MFSFFSFASSLRNCEWSTLRLLYCFQRIVPTHFAPHAYKKLLSLLIMFNHNCCIIKNIHPLSLSISSRFIWMNTMVMNYEGLEFCLYYVELYSILKGLRDNGAWKNIVTINLSPLTLYENGNGSNHPN